MSRMSAADWFVLTGVCLVAAGITAGDLPAACIGAVLSTSGVLMWIFS